MTTIVFDYKNQQIACDSRCTAGSLIVSNDDIKYKESKGKLYFFAGAEADQKYLMELSHDDKPEVEPDCGAIMVEDGKVKLVAFNNGHCSVGSMDHNRGIGSGGDFAIAALDFGKTAKEAVKYAMTRDIYTGGKVHVYDIKKSKFL